MLRRGFCAAFEGMWAEFIEVVQHADRDAAQRNVLAARQDIALALAMYESVRQRKWVRLDGGAAAEEPRKGWLVASAASVVALTAAAAAAAVLITRRPQAMKAAVRLGELVQQAALARWRRP